MTDKRISELATSLLLKQRLRGEYALSFLDCRRVLTGGKAIISSFEEFERLTGMTIPKNSEGMTLKYKGENIILYNGKAQNRERLNWTIAHELGHVFLGHRSNGERAQIEANKFAAAFLIPSSVLLFLDCRNGKELSPNEMKNYFAASLTACKMRRKELSGAEFTVSESEQKLINALFAKPDEQNESDINISDFI